MAGRGKHFERSGTDGHGQASEFVDTPVYDGAPLGPGARVDGPGLIEEPFTVVVLPPDTAAWF